MKKGIFNLGGPCYIGITLHPISHLILLKILVEDP